MRLMFIFSILFISCTSTSTHEKPTFIQESSTDPKENKKVIEDKEEGTISGNTKDCYWQILKRDTFAASLSQAGNRITGKLTFNNYEKDGSSGIVSGKIEDSIMKLWYSFESEGMKSVMEVWLKKQGQMLLRGTGDMKIKSDTSYFTNPIKVDFGGNQQMKKVDCIEVPSKYK